MYRPDSVHRRGDLLIHLFVTVDHHRFGWRRRVAAVAVRRRSSWWQRVQNGGYADVAGEVGAVGGALRTRGRRLVEQRMTTTTHVVVGRPRRLERLGEFGRLRRDAVCDSSTKTPLPSTLREVYLPIHQRNTHAHAHKTDNYLFVFVLFLTCFFHLFIYWAELAQFC